MLSVAIFKFSGGLFHTATAKSFDFNRLSIRLLIYFCCSLKFHDSWRGYNVKMLFVLSLSLGMLQA